MNHPRDGSLTASNPSRALDTLSGCHREETFVTIFGSSRYTFHRVLLKPVSCSPFRRREALESMVSESLIHSRLVFCLKLKFLLGCDQHRTAISEAGSWGLILYIARGIPSLTQDFRIFYLLSSFASSMKMTTV